MTSILLQKLQMDILVPTERSKMVANRHISLPRNIPKCFCGQCSGPDPTWEAPNAPQTTYVNLAATPWRRGEGDDKKMEVKEGERRL